MVFFFAPWHIADPLALLEEVLCSKADVGTFNENAFTGLRNSSVFILSVLTLGTSPHLFC